MKALLLNTRTKTLSLKEIPEPNIQKNHDVKLRVLEVGVCGTDREQITHGGSMLPTGGEELIFGHEMLGEVVEIGQGVKSFKKGDLAVATVRRGCSSCKDCLRGRSDLCYSGEYLERGIKGLHGFQSEYILEDEKHLVQVPHSLREIGVLAEPLSVVEKAIDETLNLQRSRLADWRDVSDYKNKTALIAGLGPIGLLACFILRLHEFKIYGLDIVERDSPRAQILEKIGGSYIDGRTVKTHDLPKSIGQIDFIFEAAGVAKLDFDLLEILGLNGGYVLTGIPHSATFEINGGKLMHHFVLKNQLALGSVNAAKKHWECAIASLEKANARWPHLLPTLITSRITPEQLQEKISVSDPKEIKMIVTWSTK